MADVQTVIKHTLIDREANALDFKMITFVLAGKEYGVDIMSVKEIQKGSRFTYVPNAPIFVRGVYNLRGDIIPVIDLRKFFGLPEYEERQELEDILILRQQDSVIGVIVDGIQKVVGVNRSEIQPAHPLFADVVGLDYIYGVVEKDESLYVILDTKVILGSDKEEEEEHTTEDKGTPGTVLATPVTASPAPPPAIEPAGVTSKAMAVPVETSASVAQAVVQQQEAIEGEVIVVHQEDVASIETESEPTEDVVSIETESEPSEDVVSIETESKPTEEVEIGSISIASGDDFKGPSDAFYEGLFEYANFCPSELNQEWLFKQYEHWSVDHLTTGKPDAEETKKFLESFYSSHAAELWDEEMVDEFCELVAQDEQKITHIWNVGSGQGFSAYSIAGGLFLRNKRCKVYATDSDLLAITGAPGLTFTEADIPDGFERAMVEGPKGWQFSNEVKNTIIFEYHDIANEHSFPKLNVVVVRDILSFVDEDVFMKFFDRIFKQAHPGTLLIIGDNEKLTDNSVWSPVDSRCFSAYRKIG